MNTWRQRHVRIYMGPDERHEAPAPWETCHVVSKVRRPTRVRHVDDRIAARASVQQDDGVAAVYRQTAQSFRSFPNAEQVLLPLAEPFRATPSFEEIVRARRSLTTFAAATIDLGALSWILAMSSGATAVGGLGKLFRAAPSAGGLFELETYLVAARVDGLAPGLYHYDVQAHALARLRGGEVVDDLVAASIFADSVRSAPAALLYTSVIGRLLWKYEHRAYRHTLLDAGHLVENAVLAAAASGLASCPFAAFYDDELAAVLDVDGVTEIPIHMVLVGRAESAASIAPTGAGPRLRRLDGLRLSPEARSASSLDQLVRAAFAHVAAGRTDAGRRALVECAAILPGDATVRDLAALAGRTDVVLAASPRALFAFPAEWPEPRRAAWIAATETELDRVLAWLEVSEAPSVFVDLVEAAAVPTTLNRDRLLVRKIVWPLGLELEDARDQLAHELVHACYLPHHRFFAEGIASLAIATDAELAAIDAELASRDRSPIDGARLFDEVGRADGTQLLVATSFVAYLVREHGGKAALFQFANAILYPAPPADLRAAAAAFATAFGVTCTDASQRWWKGLER
jgi:SagB-type dehydrogenase family enzyme